MNMSLKGMGFDSTYDKALCVNVYRLYTREQKAEWWRGWNKRDPSWTHFLRRTLLAFTSLLWELYTQSPLSSHPSISTLPSSFFHFFPSLPFPAPSATVATQILFITQHKETHKEMWREEEVGQRIEGGADWEETGRRSTGAGGEDRQRVNEKKVI